MKNRKRKQNKLNSLYSHKSVGKKLKTYHVRPGNSCNSVENVNKLLIKRHILGAIPYFKLPQALLEKFVATFQLFMEKSPFFQVHSEQTNKIVFVANPLVCVRVCEEKSWRLFEYEL